MINQASTWRIIVLYIIMDRCQAILLTGSNAGSRCSNSTNGTLCGVHKSRNTYLDFNLIPDVALRNVFDHLDAESLKKFSETSKASKEIANLALVTRKNHHDEAMAFLAANCDTGDLMERIHHLNNYMSYDPIGITVKNKESIKIWKKGTNKITKTITRDTRGTVITAIIWYNINGQHRIGGPAVTMTTRTHIGNNIEVTIVD